MHITKSMDATPARSSDSQRGWAGLALGFIGVLVFSFTLPATRAAAPELGGFTVGLVRAVVAAMLAALLLIIRREPLPPRSAWRSLAVVGFGVIIGFPLLTSLALQRVNASHSAVINGLMPAATAIASVIFAGERPPRPFWLGVLLGLVAIFVFALSEGAGQLQPDDVLLFLAVLMGSVGYAEGGKLARTMGGWRVICWALVFALPFISVPAALTLHGRDLAQISTTAWAGLAYVSVFSMFLGFFAWYSGLAIGGVARVSQVQLMQPFLTIVWSSLLLNEMIKPLTVIAALLVVVSVAFTQWVMRQYRARRG